MEGEVEKLKKKLPTLQEQHNQAYELLKNLQDKESAGNSNPTPSPRKAVSGDPQWTDYGHLMENMEIKNCP